MFEAPCMRVNHGFKESQTSKHVFWDINSNDYRFFSQVIYFTIKSPKLKNQSELGIAIEITIKLER